MLGPRNYLLASTGLAFVLAVILAALFAARGQEPLLFAALGWAPLALIGVVGGWLAVKVHGTSGAAFPLTLLTCILLRLIFGLGGLFPAMQFGQVTPYLTALFGTFVTMQVLEMVWFFRRARRFQGATMNPAQ
jgi:hypothetical protein